MSNKTMSEGAGLSNLPQGVLAVSFQPNLSPSIILLLSLALISICLLTRLLSSYIGASRAVKGGNGEKTVPVLPSWFPGIGHLLQLMVSPDSMTKQPRDNFSPGLFAWNLVGTTVNVVHSPTLSRAILGQKESVLNNKAFLERLVTYIFPIPQKEFATAQQAFEALTAETEKHLMREPYVGQMLEKSFENLKENVPNLVSGMPSLVDQTAWERSSHSVVVTEIGGSAVTETNLLLLVKNFMAHTVGPSLTGSAIIHNHPEFFDDLFTFDAGFLYLAIGLPRWFPIPRVTRAHIARRRCLRALEAFELALEADMEGRDPGPQWRDLSDVSPLFRARHALMRQPYDLSVSARAVLDLGLVWGMHANANVLVVWMLLHICSSASLLSRVREEFHRYCYFTQQPATFGLPEPPRLSIDVGGLVNDCPLLKSCYVECLRLNVSAHSVKKIHQDFVITDKVTVDATGNNPETYKFHKGEYVDLSWELYATDPKYYPEPEVWHAERHMPQPVGNAKGMSGSKVALGNLKPFGSGKGICKGRLFAEKECLTFCAAILALWDIEPAISATNSNTSESWADLGWRMPTRGKAAGVAAPRGDLRVRIKKRVLPQA